MSILKIGFGIENAVYGTITTMALIPPTNPKYPPQYQCELESGDTIFLDKSSCERQAARLDLLPNELAGIPLRFWKKLMEGETAKGYLNIDKATAPAFAGNAVRSAVMSDDYVSRELRSNGVPLTATTFEAIKDKYVETLGAAVSIADDFAAFTDGKALSEAGMLSVAATLFIARDRKGV